jgi:uncharacterized protein (TIGR03066 family)
MRLILCGVLVATVFVLSLSADDKKVAVDAQKLLGKWEPKDKKKGAQIEFLKDGKLMLGNPRDKAQLDGTYKLDGARLTVTVKFGDMENVAVLTITKLTETELVTTNEARKVETFVRIKGK